MNGHSGAGDGTLEEHSPVWSSCSRLARKTVWAPHGVLQGEVTQSKPLTCHICLYPRKFQQRLHLLVVDLDRLLPVTLRVEEDLQCLRPAWET